MHDADHGRHRHGQGHGMGRGHGHHHQSHSPDMAERHKRDQEVFHELLRRHDAIGRRVDEVPGGIRAETWSDDPALAALLRGHVAEMHRRLTEGFSLRHWDPPFPEIFAQRDKVRMVVTETARGVMIEETSDDPNVALLIRTHGAVVSGFVSGGGRVASQPTPLPEGYVRVSAG